MDATLSHTTTFQVDFLAESEQDRCMPRKPKLDYTCFDCKRTLLPEAFSLNRARANGRDGLCRTCRAGRWTKKSGRGQPIPLVLPDVVAGKIAMLIDGEGSIRFRWSDTGGYSLEITVTNTHTGLLEWLRAQVGGHVVLHQKATERARESWRWVLTSRMARALLPAIGPHLIVKKRHAELVTIFYETLSAYKERCPGGLRRHSLQEPLLGIVVALEALNRRGPTHGVVAH
jgi:hypothetical protein